MGILSRVVVIASQLTIVVKNPPANAGDLRDAGLIPGWEDPLEKEMTITPVFLPGEAHGGEEPMKDRGAWWAAVHGVTKSRTQLCN